MTCTLYVGDGRVACPRRGDVDVDLCATCPELVDIRQRGDATYVVCRPTSRSPLVTYPYF